MGDFMKDLPLAVGSRVCGVNGTGNLNEVTMNVTVSVEMFMTITVRALSDSD